ncbi:MAG: Holliday junction resolvase Hjc [Candidatus Micrarchaeaceae archaeon]
MTTIKQRASNVERKIVSLFRDQGFAVIRAPASGSKSKQPLPDIVALKDGKIIVIEVKSRVHDKNVYISKEQYDGILRFAQVAGAKAYVAVKNPDGLHFVNLEELEKTRGENYAVPREKIMNGLTFTQLVDSLRSASSTQ